MRQKPDLPDSAIQDCLFHQYGLPAVQVTFLPRGGDIDAAVYQIIAADGTAYFLKLRRGTLDEISLSVPKFLLDSGIPSVIAPVMTTSRQLWTRLAGFHVILYPFVEGRTAFESPLTERQWVAFGAALRAVHAAALPADLAGRVPRETYAPQWRERVESLLRRIEQDVYPEPVAAQYAAFLREKAGEIRHIVHMAGRLAAMLQAQAPAYTLCHSDIHAGNLLIDAGGSLYLVDWDFPILAPKERDLMFIGGGVGSAWSAPQEEALFYYGYGLGFSRGFSQRFSRRFSRGFSRRFSQGFSRRYSRGYSPAQVDPVALAYYRFERIVQDIAEWGERVLFTDQGGQDRARWLQGLHRWFQPQDVVQMAYRAEQLLPPELRS